MFVSINPLARCRQCLMAHSQNISKMVEKVCFYSAEISITDGRCQGKSAGCLCVPPPTTWFQFLTIYRVSYAR